jgi:hypothetical protein
MTSRQIGDFTLDHEVLDALNLHRFDPWIAAFNAPYFHLLSGIEHYRLLAFMAEHFQGAVFLDIGTFLGASALALSYNPANMVYSYDVADSKQFAIPAPNIEFRIGDIIFEPELDLILTLASIIMVDCNHDGHFERAFYQRLKNSPFSGYLLLDDIHLNKPMESFWSDIDLPKTDITEFGHASGTGLVCFAKEE